MGSQNREIHHGAVSPLASPFLDNAFLDPFPQGPQSPWILKHQTKRQLSRGLAGQNCFGSVTLISPRNSVDLRRRSHSDSFGLPKIPTLHPMPTSCLTAHLRIRNSQSFCSFSPMQPPFSPFCKNWKQLPGPFRHEAPPAVESAL